MEPTIAWACFEQLRPTSEDYAALPVESAFSWSDCAAPELAGEWYMVVFRSIRRATADEGRLREYDDRAAEDAQQSAGYVHYFKGPLTPERACVSFCLWNSRQEARAAATHAPHLAAVRLIGEMYERYTLEFWRVTKRLGASRFEFEPYDQVAAA